MPDDNPQASALDSTLADLLDLTLLAKHSHWNVSGPRFQSVHAFLDELAELAIESADDVAERAVTLGHSPDGRAAKIASSSSLPRVAGGPATDAQTIAAFTAILDAIVSRIHVARQAFDTDPVTVDLLTRIVGRLEKCAWIVRAQA